MDGDPIDKAINESRKDAGIYVRSSSLAEMTKRLKEIPSDSPPPPPPPFWAKILTYGFIGIWFLVCGIIAIAVFFGWWAVVFSVFEYIFVDHWKISVPILLVLLSLRFWQRIWQQI